MEVIKLSPNFDAESWEIGRIHTHAILVKAGVRLVAQEIVQNDCVKICLEIITSEDLHYILTPAGETHTAIYIFKFPGMQNVINFTLGKPYNKSDLKCWIEGKMFGYSDEEIMQFIKDNSNPVTTD